MSLTKDCYLPSLVQLSEPASLLASIAFYWDKKKEIFKKMGARGMLRHKVTTYIHAISVGSMLVQTLLYWEKEFSKLLISSFGLIVLNFTLITVWVYHLKMDTAMSLINELIKMSKELQKSSATDCAITNSTGARRPQLDGKEKFIKFMAPLFHWSAMSVPFAFVGGVVWSMPCLNSSFAWQVLPECPSGHPGMNFTFMFFILTNIILWSYSIQCAVFVVIGVVMLGAMSIRYFLKFYQSVMLSPPTSPLALHKTGLIYRRIQLLSKILNEIHSTWVLVPLLFTVSSHQVFSMYGAIKFNGQLNFVSYCLFALLANQGVLVIMGMFTALGDVHTISVKVSRNLVKAHRRHKWLRRFHSGCTLVTIHFGNINYVDSTTPLIFENFALLQTSNMLLLD